MDHSYERKLGGANGSGVDTDDNASDFQLIAPSTPQNLASVITPALTVSPSPVDFGSVARGSTAGATVTITNHAASPVAMTTPFTISGTNASDFAVGAPGSTTVAAGATTTASVTFQPTTLGNKSATLTIASTSGETHAVALTGVSVCPVITVSAVLPNVEAGVFYSRTVTASGGASPYRFAITTGALPSGLSLDPSSGVLSGSTTATGVFTFTIQATEDDGTVEGGCGGSTSFTLTVADTIAPSVSCAAPDGAWHALNVSLACTASDNGTGLANPSDATFSLVTSVGAGIETNNASTGSRAVCDVAGNCMTAGPIAGNKIDRKGPGITLTTPANGAVYQQFQAVNGSYTCSDGGSGLATCAGTVPNLSYINTLTLGSKTFVVNATDATGNASTATVTYDVRRTLTAVEPFKVWIGLKNSDAVGLRLDLRAELLVNGTVAAAGTLNNVSSGSSGFNNAILQSLGMSLTSGPVDLPAGAQVAMRVSARRTCFGSGHNSGTARAWFNGLPIDNGPLRDAGSRIEVTVAGATWPVFLRSGFDLALLPGISRQSVDAAVNSGAACPARPFVPFGVWNEDMP